MERDAHATAMGGSLRGMFTPQKEKQLNEKMEKRLKLAVCHLFQLDEVDSTNGFSHLEQQVLGLEAFLLPWADYRDGFYLVPTSVNGALRESKPGEVTRRDILVTYTQFDEGKLRTHPRDASAERTVDKSGWIAAEHEMFLFAWLLQSFKVGKAKNPLGFVYFQCKNVATVFEEVFLPIVDAVRESYNKPGRRNYGRLASFIEGRAPSQLAFPQPNIDQPKQVASGASETPSTPYRMVTSHKEYKISSDPYDFGPSNESLTVAASTDTDEEGDELRQSYSQYGGIFSKPKFNGRVSSWLAEQKEKKARKETLAALETKHRYSSKIGDDSDDSKAWNRHSLSSLRRNASTKSTAIRQSFGHSSSQKASPAAAVPYGRYGFVKASDTPSDHRKSDKSKVKEGREPSLHGVTREVEIPPTPNRPHGSPKAAAHTPHRRRRYNKDPHYISDDDEDVPHMPKIGGASIHQGDVLTPVERDFNVEPKGKGKQRASDSDNESPREPYQIIRPAYSEYDIYPHVKRDVPVRLPRYEVTANDEPPPPKHTPARRQNTTDSAATAATTSNTEEEAPNTPVPRPRRAPAPAPIVPVGYIGNRYIMRSKAETKDNTPRKIPWPGTYDSPPLGPRGRGSDNDDNDVDVEPDLDLARGFATPVLGPRIVSKENIRAALGRCSPSDDEGADGEEVELEVRSRPQGPTLRTFNSHMFPRQARIMEEKYE
ncbi:hypothetical protein BS50DRAFT_651099 [Corynespora cassiicola Philippines]|uniref:Uncharacterized protein n=1 Tax=Corynespora cassiicola Philippines TaxID=1448308 RepID=A0A2T2N9J1_CORCC|nr:hypothetical protein BS50DRAFT_651099 [Corynespora cassiicola Philippines]